MITHNHAWGESWDIYRDKSVWVVGFRGREGGASSLHRHERMTHSIYISSGLLKVSFVDETATYSSRGKPGTLLSIGQESHRLRFLADTEGIETYYALPGHEIDPSDIVRISPARAPDAVVA